MEECKQVIIDRGIYRLGMRNTATGEETEPSWESTFKGMSLVIGHEDEQFSISSVKDLDFILRELNERLKLDLPIEKFRCEDCEYEFYADIDKLETPEYCPYCGSLNINNTKDIEE